MCSSGVARRPEANGIQTRPDWALGALVLAAGAEAEGFRDVEGEWHVAVYEGGSKDIVKAWRSCPNVHQIALATRGPYYLELQEAEHNGAVGWGEAAKHSWAGKRMDGGIRAFTALLSSMALSDAPRAPAKGPAGALEGPVGDWLLLGATGGEVELPGLAVPQPAA
eukprot:1408560-Alexandrium_andersonii.AAC.1